MNLVETIQLDYVGALKAGQKFRVGVLRLLRAEIKNKEIDSPDPLSDEQVLAIIRSMIKKRQEAAEVFRSGGRDDKAAAELAENEILTAYLPPVLDEAELDRLIGETIAEVGAHGAGDLGKVMKALVPKIAGRADNKIVNQKVRQALTD
ncbi:MAG: GatB/YqeY domain-containing protein [Myxococcales bacterium]|nr:GatB/YqeY domain-containing protein [Myxococcales bacterium]